MVKKIRGVSFEFRGQRESAPREPVYFKPAPSQTQEDPIESALDPEARGNVTKYYELKDSVDTAVRTMNLLEKSGDPKEFAKYVQENAGTLAFRSYVSDMEKSMKELRDMRKQVLNSPMGADQKRDVIKTIGQMENNLSANTQTIKKTIEKVQSSR